MPPTLSGSSKQADFAGHGVATWIAAMPQFPYDVTFVPDNVAILPDAFLWLDAWLIQRTLLEQHADGSQTWRFEPS